MRLVRFIATVFSLSLGASSYAGSSSYRIAFGSCAHQDRDQPIWTQIAAEKPDVFLFIGDNIYGDSEDITVLRRKYQMLGDKRSFQDFKNQLPILATWDDHDFGRNDAGREFPSKRESQQAFLDFFDVPKDSPRRQQEGVYFADIKEWEGHRIQFILLDTRYFRSPLLRDKTGYIGNSSPDATMLGEQQWQWLEQELQKPAELRIVASSIQFLSKDHGYEKWGNFPRERQRFIDLLAKTKAEGVVFVSGDRHLGELSVLQEPTLGYRIYDFTSSGMTEGSNDVISADVNSLRLPGTKAHQVTQFGMIEVGKGIGDRLQLTFELIDGRGNILERSSLPLNDLHRPLLGRRRE